MQTNSIRNLPGGWNRRLRLTVNITKCRSPRTNPEGFYQYEHVAIGLADVWLGTMDSTAMVVSSVRWVARLLLGGWALQWLGLTAIAVSYRVILISAGLMGMMCFFGSVLYPD